MAIYWLNYSNLQSLKTHFISQSLLAPQQYFCAFYFVWSKQKKNKKGLLTVPFIEFSTTGIRWNQANVTLIALIFIKLKLGHKCEYLL